MNWLDFVMIFILLIALIGGVSRGLMISLFGFAGFALGFKLAGDHNSFIASKLTFIQNEAAANVLGFVIVWAAAMVAAGMVGMILKKAVSLVGLGWLDRLGGLVFGLALGIFSCVLLVAVMLNFPVVDFSGAIQESKIASFLVHRLAFFFQLLPGDWGQSPLLPPVNRGIPA